MLLHRPVVHNCQLKASLAMPHPPPGPINTPDPLLHTYPSDKEVATLRTCHEQPPAWRLLPHAVKAREARCARCAAACCPRCGRQHGRQAQGQAPKAEGALGVGKPLVCLHGLSMGSWGRACTAGRNQSTAGVRAQQPGRSHAWLPAGLPACLPPCQYGPCQGAAQRSTESHRFPSSDLLPLPSAWPPPTIPQPLPLPFGLLTSRLCSEVSATRASSGGPGPPGFCCCACCPLAAAGVPKLSSRTSRMRAGVTPAERAQHAPWTHGPKGAELPSGGGPPRLLPAALSPGAYCQSCSGQLSHVASPSTSPGTSEHRTHVNH